MSTNKPAETLTPKFSKLYWCRYGFNGGKQVCLFLGYSESDGYVVRKWRANSGRWTDRVTIRKNDLTGAVTAAEANRLGVDVGKL